MPTLFALSDGDISTIGSLNSAAPTIANQGVIGSQLSANRALAASTSYTNNTLVYGIALCLSSVGTVDPGQTLRIRLSTVNYDYDATGLSLGEYSNKFVTTAPQAMVGWVLFKLPAPVSFSAAPPLSVFGPNTVRLMGSAATTPASILVYGPYNNTSQPADIVYLTKALTTGLVTEGRNVSGFLSAANVYICDSVKSENNFNISSNVANSIYIGRGGLFTGTVVVTGLNWAYNQFIHVLDGAVLSANYTTPTITGRIKAADSAIVDLNNVIGFNMLSPGLYNNSTNTGNNIIRYDYLHDITTGYAKFRNTTFWAGVTASNKNTNTSNLSVYNCIFPGKYIHTSTVTATNTISFGVEEGCTLSNVLLTGINCQENALFMNNYSNYNLKASTFEKKIDINNCNFSNSNFSDITFPSNSAFDSVAMSGNSSLPIFNNIIITERKTGINKGDSCSLYLNGLSCISPYFYSLLGSDLNGEINNFLITNSTYGMYDMAFINTSAPLTINGLTAIRAETSILTSQTNYTISTAPNAISAVSPFPGLSSARLSSVNTRIEIDMPRLLSYNDDFTVETWYYPTNARSGTHTIFSVWDQLSTVSTGVGCIFVLSVYSSGQLGLYKGSSSNGAASFVFTTPLSSLVFNNRWYNIVITKSSSIYSLYVDGNFVLSADNQTEFFQPRNSGAYKVYIGARPSSRTAYVDAAIGYTAGAKMSYGVKYNGNFTPSLTPFTVDDGTIINYIPGNSATYSLMPRSFIDLENSKSYYPLIMNDVKLAGNNPLSSNLIDVSNSYFEKLEVNDSDLRTAGKTLVMRNNLDYSAGSYLFNNCLLTNEVADVNSISGYQPYTYRETGVAAQNANGDSNNHYRWTRGGKVSLDTSNTYFDLPTEKLESISNDYYLRSNLKLIPVSQTSTLTGISLTYKTPIGYVSGGSLKLDKNTILGINEAVVIKELTPTNDTWTTITASLSNYRNPLWTQKAYLESYVELIGTNNQLHIAKWQASTI